MMQLTDGLKDKVWRQIEEGADPDALPQLRAAIAQIEDPQQREAISDAALALAGAWADAALWLGWQMRADPGAWIFQPAEESHATPGPRARDEFGKVAKCKLTIC